MRRLSLLAAAALSALAAGVALCDKELTRVQVGKLGKAATALVECDLAGGKAHGSAFCVHAGGLFVTNEHVVRNASAVRLVLNPSLKAQRVITARVVRADKDTDLALLRAEQVKDLPTLSLGSSDDLEEAMEVLAVGFPFGRALTVKGEDYPAVSINIGSVTSLRRKGGELYRIQTDAALNRGNSGGPVLDRKGKVIGVVVSGVTGAGVNFVIPVNKVAAFLARPELELKLPAVAWAARGQEAAFEARAAALVPGGKALELELTLSGPGKSRSFAMTREGEVYRARAVPAPSAPSASAPRVTVRYANGQITGEAADATIKVGGQAVKLSELRAVRLGAAASAERRDGKVLSGAVAGLDALELKLGDEAVKVSLKSATGLAVEREDGAVTITCTVVARQGDKEVGRVSEALTIREPTAVAADGGGAPAGGVTTSAAKLEADKVERKLPAPVSDAVAAGGGRYLLLQMPKLKRVAIFDVSAAKITGYIPLGGDNARIAAGMDKVVIVLPNEGLIQRWDLATQKRELMVASPVKGKFSNVVMGSASAGPVVISAIANHIGDPHMLDLKTLKAAGYKIDPRHLLSGGPDEPLRASADGRVLTMYRPSISPQGLRVLVLTGREGKGHYDHDSFGHLLPDDEGRFIYTARGVFTSMAKPVGKTGREGLYCLPAVRGPYYIGMRINAGGAGQHLAQLFIGGDSQPLFTLRDIDWPEGMNEWDREAFPSDRRIWFIPEAKALITIPTGQEKLVLHKLDVDAALEKSEIDYLFVASRPPLAVRKGGALSYAMQVKSKKGGVKFSVSSGPDGLSVDARGVVSWRVPADYKEKTANVIISVTDRAEQEAFHSFTLNVE